MVHPLELIHPRSLKQLSDVLQGLVRGRLWLQVMIGLVFGVIVGLLLGPTVAWVDARSAVVIGNWLALPGKLFLSAVQLVVVPLVVASVIRGLAASEDVDQLRRTGIGVGAFYVVTSALAILIGMWLANLLQPGQFFQNAMVQASLTGPVPDGAAATDRVGLGGLPDLLVTLLPTSALDALVHGQMLQIILFTLIVGVALVMMAPEQSRPLLDLLGSLQEVCMTILRWVMWLAPLAVFGFIAQLVAKTGVPSLLGILAYVGTVLLGLGLLMFIYLAAVRYVIGIRPVQFLTAARQVLLLGFSTSSSAAVMPLSIRTAEEKLTVRPSIAQLVVPLGATLNMGGVAMYQAIAAVFLVQVFGVDIGFGGLLLIVVVSVGAAIGSPGTPGVSLAILAAVLATVGVPPAAIALIMGVDRILDMCRTALNITGDLAACSLMNHWVGGKRSLREELAEQSAQEWQRSVTGRDVIVQPPRGPQIRRVR